MREKVLILLNERESHKVKAAEALEARLSELSITSSRLDADADLEQLVLAQRPKCLILDYLLGDYSTGLDIQAQLSELDEGARPHVIFLTDEPSVPVAVEALQGGALDYIELDHPQAISRVVAGIEQLLESDSTSAPEPLREIPPLEDLVANSDNTRVLKEQVMALALEEPKIVLIHGPAGSGVTCWLQALQVELSSERVPAEIDLRLSRDSLESVLLGPHSLFGGKGFRNDVVLLCDNAEEDDGELLELVQERNRFFWPADRQPGQSVLLVGTHCERTSESWRKLTDCVAVRLPPLAERTEDIPALAHRFAHKAGSFCKRKAQLPDATVISTLSSWEWPGEIRELEAVVTDAVIRSSFSDRPLKELIEESRELWQQTVRGDSLSDAIDPYLAASVLERFGHRYRIASAFLGCSVDVLQSTIQGGKSQDGEKVG